MDDIENLLAEMEQEISEGRRAMFFGSGVIINPETMYALIDRVRSCLPDVIQEARHLINNRDQFIGAEQARAQRMIAEAQARVDQMVSESNIVQTAMQEANRIVDNAGARAQEIAREMNEDIQRTLAAVEHQLASALERVRRARTGGNPQAQDETN